MGFGLGFNLCIETYWGLNISLQVSISGSNCTILEIFVKGAVLSVNSVFYMSLKLELDPLITCNLLKFGIILGANQLFVLI